MRCSTMMRDFRWRPARSLVAGLGVSSNRLMHEVASTVACERKCGCPPVVSCRLEDGHATEMVALRIERSGCVSRQKVVQGQASSVVRSPDPEGRMAWRDVLIARTIIACATNPILTHKATRQ